jgi:hypothetical protein
VRPHTPSSRCHYGGASPADTSIRLLQDPWFASEVKARWGALRADKLSDARLQQHICSEGERLREPAARNFAAWGTLVRCPAYTAPCSSTLRLNRALRRGHASKRVGVLTAWLLAATGEMDMGLRLHEGSAVRDVRGRSGRVAVLRDSGASSPLDGAQHSIVPTVLSEGSSLSPGKGLHHQRSSRHAMVPLSDTSPHPEG